MITSPACDPPKHGSYSSSYSSHASILYTPHHGILKQLPFLFYVTHLMHLLNSTYLHLLSILPFSPFSLIHLLSEISLSHLLHPFHTNPWLSFLKVVVGDSPFPSQNSHIQQPSCCVLQHYHIVLSVSSFSLPIPYAYAIYIYIYENMIVWKKNEQILAATMLLMVFISLQGSIQLIRGHIEREERENRRMEEEIGILLERMEKIKESKFSQLKEIKVLF